MLTFLTLLLTRLKNWTIALATHKYATPAMAWVAFFESSVFLMPPDAMLVPMVLSNPTRKWRLAFICTTASVLGAVLGYVIGYALFDTIGQPIIASYNASAAFEKFKSFYDDWGFWIVVISAVSFLPFKVATIASGVVGLNPIVFIIACAIGRAMRFYGVTLIVTTNPRIWGGAWRKFKGNWLNNPKRHIGLLMAGTLSVIGTALAFEYIGGLQPCALCLEQRLPYYAALIMTPLVFWAVFWAVTKNNRLFANIGLGLIALGFIIGGGLGVYHAGVEWHFWAGPAGCSGGAINTSADIDALMQSLKSAPIIRCDEAPWRLFGLSMAGYNALASFGLAGLAAYPIFRAGFGVRGKYK